VLNINIKNLNLNFKLFLIDQNFLIFISFKSLQCYGVCNRIKILLILMKCSTFQVLRNRLSVERCSLLYRFGKNPLKSVSLSQIMTSSEKNEELLVCWDDQLRLIYNRLSISRTIHGIKLNFFGINYKKLFFLFYSVKIF